MQSYKVPQNKFGQAMANPLSLGQDASTIPTAEYLPAQYYYLGELVCVNLRGRRMIGQITAMPDTTGSETIAPKYMQVACGQNAIKYVSQFEIPHLVSKLRGQFYVSGCASLREPSERGLVCHPATICPTIFRPVVLGQDASNSSMNNGLQLECYNVGEMVAINWAGNSKIFAKITALNAAFALVAIENGDIPVERYIPAQEIPATMYKLMGSYCEANPMPTVTRVSLVA